MSQQHLVTIPHTSHTTTHHKWEVLVQWWSLPTRFEVLGPIPSTTKKKKNKKKNSFLVPSPPLGSKSRGSSVMISQKGMHRQFPSWLPPNAPFRVGETFCCPSLGTPDQIPGHSMHRKPFRRLTNLLGMSQETWAISWGIHVFTDGCMQSAVCVLFSETAQAPENCVP